MRRELSEVEQRIAALEREKQALAQQMADPATFASDGGAQATARQLGHVEHEITKLEARWLELGDAIDQLG